jgi:DNA (cytosine-5)-methyltransferase 1
MPTITDFDALALAQPFLVMLNGSGQAHIDPSARSIDDPIPTIVPGGHVGLADPYLVKYYGTGGAVAVDEPLPTQGGKDHFGLVEPYVFQDEAGQLYLLDIRFRMLQPKELAAAMSFPDDYQFQGNREQVVKQIGNAVPVRTAQALCRELLS